MMKPATFVASLVLAGVSIPCVLAAPLAQRRFIPLHNIPDAELAVQDEANAQLVTSRGEPITLSGILPGLPHAELPVPAIHVDTESIGADVGFSTKDNTNNKPLVTRDGKLSLPSPLGLDLPISRPNTKIGLSTREEAHEDHDKEGQIPVDLSELDSLRSADLEGVPLDPTFFQPPSHPPIKPHDETLTARDGISTSSLLGDKLNIPLIDILLHLVKSREGHTLLTRNQDLAIPLLDLVNLDLSISNPTPQTRISLTARNEQVNLPILNKVPLVDILLGLVKGREGGKVLLRRAEDFNTEATSPIPETSISLSTRDQQLNLPLLDKLPLIDLLGVLRGSQGGKGLLRRAQDLNVPLLDFAHLDLSVSNPSSNTRVGIVTRSEGETAAGDESSDVRRNVPLVDLILDSTKGRDGLLVKREEGVLSRVAEEEKRALPGVDTVLGLVSDNNGHLGTGKLLGLTKTVTNLPLLSRLGLSKGGASGANGILGGGGVAGLGGLGGVGGLLGRREQDSPPYSHLEDLAARGKIAPRPLPIVARHLDDEVPSLRAHGKNTRDTDERDAALYAPLKRGIQLSRHNPLGSQSVHTDEASLAGEHEKRSALHHLDRRQGVSIWSAFYCEGPNYRGQCTTQEFVPGACEKISDPAYHGKLLSFLASSSNCALYEGDTCSGSSVPIYSAVQDLRAFPRTASFRCRLNGVAAVTNIPSHFSTSSPTPTPIPNPPSAAPPAPTSAPPSQTTSVTSFHTTEVGPTASHAP